jgi:signal transduction histidine kinase
MVSEYRALRASVIRLWTAENGSLTGADLDDLTRFNEAIDQSLAESVTRYTQDLDQSKELFIAILGHDLRTPLAAVIMSSQFMLDTGELRDPHLTLATRIVRSARRMNQMVGDLLDFTTIRLGSGVPLVREPGDLSHARAARRGRDGRRAPAVRARARRGGRHARRLGRGADRPGAREPARQRRAARLHDDAGARHRAGRRRGRGAAGEQPRAGDPADLDPGSLQPAQAAPGARAAARDARHLGLGLYIAERVVAAHGGSIDVSSSDDAGTAFTVRLPRR